MGILCLEVKLLVVLGRSKRERAAVCYVLVA